MQEIINGITFEYPSGTSTEISNTLTETTVGKALDATQGKALSDKFNNYDKIYSSNSTLRTFGVQADITAYNTATGKTLQTVVPMNNTDATWTGGQLIDYLDYVNGWGTWKYDFDSWIPSTSAIKPQITVLGFRQSIITPNYDYPKQGFITFKRIDEYLEIEIVSDTFYEGRAGATFALWNYQPKRLAYRRKISEISNVQFGALEWQTERNSLAGIVNWNYFSPPPPASTVYTHLELFKYMFGDSSATGQQIGNSLYQPKGNSKHRFRFTDGTLATRLNIPTNLFYADAGLSEGWNTSYPLNDNCYPYGNIELTMIGGYLEIEIRSLSTGSMNTQYRFLGYRYSAASDSYSGQFQKEGWTPIINPTFRKSSVMNASPQSGWACTTKKIYENANSIVITITGLDGTNATGNFLLQLATPYSRNYSYISDSLYNGSTNSDYRVNATTDVILPAGNAVPYYQNLQIKCDNTKPVDPTATYTIVIPK